MICVDRELKLQPAYDFSKIAPLSRIVFFDIETTGFVAGKASLYLIGIVHHASGSWRLRQWFAESLLDEEPLLEAFFDFLAEKRRESSAPHLFLIQYNGAMFDLPFVKRCAAQYHLPYSFSDVIGIDLYQKVKPFKKLLRLENCRLKTVEQSLGIAREDRYSGGELIAVYEEYLRLGQLSSESCEATPQNEALRAHLLQTLLLHNAEDIANLPLVCGILAYEELYAGAFSFISAEVLKQNSGAEGGFAAKPFLEAAQENGVTETRAQEEETQNEGAQKEGEQLILKLRFRLESPLPAPLCLETPDWTLRLDEEDRTLFELTVQLFSGELKYFFADYKNYYYLTMEDYAVHKSVGEYVDRKVRRQATAKTCYQRRRGVFLPEPEPIFAPVLYRAYKTPPQYAELPKELLAVPAKKWEAYALAVLNSLK